MKELGKPLDFSFMYGGVHVIGFITTSANIPPRMGILSSHNDLLDGKVSSEVQSATSFDFFFVTQNEDIRREIGQRLEE